MFTCPENDIHSIYLDNELPEKFKTEYESHIASCQKCKAKLDTLQKTHEVFKYDSNSLNLDKKFIKESFNRLQIKMRYAKNVAKTSDNTHKESFTIFHDFKKSIPAAVAAAAVFALLLPFGLKFQKEQSAVPEVANVQTMKRTSNFSIDQNRMLTETSDSIYPLQLTADTPYNETNFILGGLTPSFDENAQNVGRRVVKPVSNARKLLADDFFSPSFTRNDDSVLQFYTPSYVDISTLSN